MKSVRAAVVQNSAVVFNREATLEKVARLVKDAKREGAELVVFPEAFVSAYPKGLDFGAVIGSRTAEGREDFRRYFESAVDVPGPAVDFLGQLAGDHHVHLVIGVIERDGGTLYCTVLFFSPEGKFLGKHRKLMPTASERLVWGFGDGSALPVVQRSRGALLRAFGLPVSATRRLPRRLRRGARERPRYGVDAGRQLHREPAREGARGPRVQPEPDPG